MDFRTFTLSTFFLLISLLAQGQVSDRLWKDYEFIQYISTTGSSPQNIIRLDNNSRIILSATNGIKREELEKSGIYYTESQIKLLKTWRLLNESNDKLITAFPILDSLQTTKLRSQVGEKAIVITRIIKPYIGDIKESLNSIGRLNNSYSIVFSYVLDGLIWEKFEESDLLTQREITPEQPFWVGEVWALYPKRPTTMGTNTISDRGVSLKINWNNEIIPKMLPFVADFNALTRMFENYLEHHKVVDKKARTVFAPYNIFDRTGKFTIPIIVENDSNEIYRNCIRAANKLFEAVSKELQLQTIKNEYNFKDIEQTLIITYHEMMWDIINELERLGILQKPVALSNNAIAKKSDISDLVFIVKESKKNE